MAILMAYLQAIYENGYIRIWWIPSVLAQEFHFISDTVCDITCFSSAEWKSEKKRLFVVSWVLITIISCIVMLGKFISSLVLILSNIKKWYTNAGFKGLLYKINR